MHRSILWDSGRERHGSYTQMSTFEPQNLEYVAAARALMTSQGMMDTGGARLVEVEPGRAEIELTPHPAITQQDDFVHAAAIAAILDTACGLAGRTFDASGCPRPDG